MARQNPWRRAFSGLQTLARPLRYGSCETKEENVTTTSIPTITAAAGRKVKKRKTP